VCRSEFPERSSLTESRETIRLTTVTFTKNSCDSRHRDIETSTSPSPRLLLSSRDRMGTSRRTDSGIVSSVRSSSSRLTLVLRDQGMLHGHRSWHPSWLVFFGLERKSCGSAAAAAVLVLWSQWRRHEGLLFALLVATLPRCALLASSVFPSRVISLRNAVALLCYLCTLTSLSCLFISYLAAKPIWSGSSRLKMPSRTEDTKERRCCVV
jgi:hypothetical protein